MQLVHCPMCHCPNKETSSHCRDCDYKFGQPVEVTRGLLRQQLRGARWAFWSLMVLDVSVVAGIAIAATGGIALLPVIVIAPLLWGTVRSRRKIAVSKHSLQLLEPKLPQATLVSGR
jgi:hypothetical protein